MCQLRYPRGLQLLSKLFIPFNKVVCVIRSYIHIDDHLNIHWQKGRNKKIRLKKKIDFPIYHPIRRYIDA